LTMGAGPEWPDHRCRARDRRDYRGTTKEATGLGDNTEYSSGLFVLTPSESKRLIAKGVVAMPEVEAALKSGRLVLCTGSTNAYIAEEILGEPIQREEFITGRIVDGKLGGSGGPNRLATFVLDKGAKLDIPWQEALKDLTAGDVVIKGANAVDADGYAGILLGNPVGGTIGAVLGPVVALGAHLIVPVGLEKLIPSVLDAAEAYSGVRRVKHTLDGYPVGFMPLVNATVVTEIQALETLFSVGATQMAGGGIAGSEGSVVILVEGLEPDVKECMDFVASIKGEPPVRRPS